MQSGEGLQGTAKAFAAPFGVPRQSLYLAVGQGEEGDDLVSFPVIHDPNDDGVAFLVVHGATLPLPRLMRQLPEVKIKIMIMPLTAEKRIWYLKLTFSFICAAD
jgi:hypothetical protein